MEVQNIELHFFLWVGGGGGGGGGAGGQKINMFGGMMKLLFFYVWGSFLSIWGFFKVKLQIWKMFLELLNFKYV